jgi:hypothetical protein
VYRRSPFGRYLFTGLFLVYAAMLNSYNSVVIVIFLALNCIVTNYLILVLHLAVELVFYPDIYNPRPIALVGLR